MGLLAEIIATDNDIEDETPSPSKPQGEVKGNIEVTKTGATLNNVVVESPILDDWTPVFKLFNLDPTEFEVVGNSVKMSTWQQSRAADDGTRDVIQLYSYSAKFKRRPEARLSDTDVEKRRRELRDWLPPAFAPVSGKGQPVAAIINLSDVQSGKSEGGGVAATQQRMLDGLVNVQLWLDRMRQHHNITELVLVNNGDPMEGCAGNYAAQLFTVELNTRGQMNFVLDMWEKYACQLFPQFDKAQFVSVLCNHGELGRMGSNKNQTSDSDNAGGFLAETLKRVLDSRPEFDHVEWTIPHDQMNVYPTAAGVPMGFCHGHKINGSDANGFTKWLDGQVRGDLGAHQAKVWVTAHRHNFQSWDLGSCSVFQCPSLDGGSKWFRDSTGKYSNSGILAFLVGEHFQLGWSDMAFL